MDVNRAEQLTEPAERPFSYVEFEPGITAVSAQEIALTYWGFSVRALPHPGFVHRVWPDGCIALTLISFDGRAVGARLLGVRQSPFEVPLQVGVRYWGVRFRPEAGAKWLGVSPSSLRECNVSAESVLGASVLELAAAVAPIERAEEVARLLDEWIADRPFQLNAIDTVVRSAVAAIVATDGQRAIVDIAEDVGVGVRQLQRRFALSVGLSPKAFAVLRRGRGAIKRVATDGVTAAAGGWTGIALSSGFSDQSHFTREVARLTRFAPTALRDRLDTIEHKRLID